MTFLNMLGLVSSLVVLTTRILAFNDSHQSTFRITEESPNGTEVIGVAEYLHSVIGSGLQTTYQLLDSHEMLTSLLRIKSQTGHLFVNGRIDREALCPQSSGISIPFLDPNESCNKQINILATVRINSNQEVSVRTIPIKVSIEDVNDNAPCWNSATKQMDGLPILEASILEQGMGNKVQVPAAYDPDSGRNGEISYRLENYRSPIGGVKAELDRGPAPFTISGPVSGMLQLTPFQSIDYEKRIAYDLLLIATDAGEPPNTGEAHLRVNVIDVNDEAPVFTQRVFMPPGGQGISERTHPGKVILNVTAVDGDASERNSRLTYSMVPSSNRMIEEIFSVHPDGRIILRHWLDYETLEAAHMVSSTTALREAPPAKGKQFAFFVKATDSAPSPYEKTGTALVVVPIIDENDERPMVTSKFLGSPELVKHGEAGVIAENSTVPVRLAYIQARDPDFDGRDRVECSVPENDNLSLKRVSAMSYGQSSGEGSTANNSNDFLLSLEEPIDRETTKMLQVRIHCVDEANNTADKLINIRVLDVNDETPRFLWPAFYFSVNENAKVPSPSPTSDSNVSSSGYRIGRVIAYDKDEGDNAKIVYGLLPWMEVEQPKLRPSLFPLSEYDQEVASSQASDIFRIDSTTGELFALRSFDAEKEKLIKLKVIAADQPLDPTFVSHTGTASVFVQIFDMNDWSPVFHQVVNDERHSQQLYAPSILDEPSSVDSYQFFIKENLPAYTLVGRLGAIDPDVSFWGAIGSLSNVSSVEGSRPPRGVTIHFAPGTPAYVENVFTIHAASGQLRASRPLDREAHANYTFSVIAVDRGPVDGVSRTSTALVTVLVEDENDNDPVFIRPALEMSDSKASTGRTFVESEPLSPPPPPPTLDPPSQPDPVEQIPVVAVSLPSLSGSHDITSNAVARPLIRIEAHDPDSGSNGQVRYAITGGNSDDIFYLDPTSGSLVLKTPQSVSKEAASYLLQFSACDQGTPPRCASPARLRIVMDRPTSTKPGSAGGVIFPATQNTSPYQPPPNRLHGGASVIHPEETEGYPEVWDGGVFGAYGSEWTSSRTKWEERQRYLRGDYEKPSVEYRKNGVTVSEAVIICVAVIFAVFLFAALILFFLVKRKSIYFSITGKHKRQDVETPANTDYGSNNYKNENPTTHEALESNEKASLYRMIQGTQVPGKIVFVDNNFEHQNMAEAAASETLALSPIESKGVNASIHDYGLRRGMSASAAVLTNLESVYITGPVGPEDSMNVTEYPEMITRSAFNCPQTSSRNGMQNCVSVHPTVFGTLVGPMGPVHSVSKAQPGDYGSATFQRKYSSLRPNHGFVNAATVTNASPYRYIHAPYVYTPVTGSPTAHVVHCRGLSEPTNEPYSPHTVHQRQPYAFAEDRQTYHDVDILASTLQHKRRPTEHFVEVAPPGISSPSYGRLRQPINNCSLTSAPHNRYATLNARMAPDGEVTSLMESAVTMKRVRIPVAPVTQIETAGEVRRTEIGNRSSPDSITQDFLESPFEEHPLEGEDEEPESITDPNAKLIVSEEEQTPTLRKGSESQATEELMVQAGSMVAQSHSGGGSTPHKLGRSQDHEDGDERQSQSSLSSQLPLTYTVHEASFV